MDSATCCRANQESQYERLRAVKCFLLDMDGTFYLGNRLLEGSLRFVQVLIRQGKQFLFLTNNSSQHRGIYADKITRMGLPVSADKVFTSGEATAIYLSRLKPGARVYLVGTPALKSEFASYGLRLVRARPDFAVLGFDTTLTYNKLRRLCGLVRAGVPYIATHPDLNCPTEGGFMPDIGAMIAFVEASTGRRPKVIGKPNREIIDAVCEKLGVPLSEMCMIGDRLYTDVALGATAGITTVLVLSGETRREDVASSPYRPDYVFADLAEVADALEI